MRQAEIHGYREVNSNPCSRLRRYPCPGRERFLTFDEFLQLSKVLKTHESRSYHSVTIIRLLLLTGCRQSEIRTLHWSEYREGHLFLRDSKTGPRTVWLSSIARSILDNLPQKSRWVFPANDDTAPLSVETLYRCWRVVRAEAEIPEVRLHDLRHSYASFALRKGETLLTIGRLLGHRDPSTTLKYIHFCDSMERNAVETIGKTLNADRCTHQH
ncbi:MAG: site-specific integrase [Bacteroidota bacterium]|nr:site-specific integrase [Bacteroidota bacterium]